jgi:NAD(P)-dependent dehydrogenase (short-subunit alcohol dehydrogenase family)
MAGLLSSFRLDGDVVAVTGGGNGIGRAAALALAEFGASVAVLDRDDVAGRGVVEEIAAAGGKAIAVQVDVTEESEVEAAMARVIETLDSLDVLVNSAGIAIRAATTELSLSDWNRVVAVNLTGVFLVARHAAKAMIAQKRGGRIVNIASIMGLSGGGLYPNISYQSTKGAVINLTRALAVEWAPHRIRVNAVAPTWVRTGFIEPLLSDAALVRRIEALTPLGRLADPEDVVGAILYLGSRASAMVTGHILAVDGGYLAQ